MNIKEGSMTESEIIFKHGLNDEHDVERMRAAIELVPKMPGETIEDIFITLISLEKKGLIKYGKEISAPIAKQGLTH